MPQPELSLSCLELGLRDPYYPDLIEVLDYWQWKRGRRFAPSRADIEPLDLIRALPRIMLADVLTDPLGFRYRLSGTGISDVHGEELTGLAPLDLKPAEYGRLIDRKYRQCVSERRPLLHLIVLALAHRSRAYARLLLPLSNDGEQVNMLTWTARTRTPASSGIFLTRRLAASPSRRGARRAEASHYAGNG